jgi:DNA-binding protein HU-beta
MAKEMNKNGKKSAAKPDVRYPDKFTAQSIIKYISEKHEIPRSRAKDIVEDLFDVIHEGAFNGQRVPVGKFGKLYIKLKPATKERMGRNPITGEEIKIAAKRATKVPKFTFSKSYKMAALEARIKEN